MLALRGPLSVGTTKMGRLAGTTGYGGILIKWRWVESRASNITSQAIHHYTSKHRSWGQYISRNLVILIVIPASDCCWKCRCYCPVQWRKLGMWENASSRPCYHSPACRRSLKRVDLNILLSWSKWYFWLRDSAKIANSSRPVARADTRESGTLYGSCLSISRTNIIYRCNKQINWLCFLHSLSIEK